MRLFMLICDGISQAAELFSQVLTSLIKYYFCYIKLQVNMILNEVLRLYPPLISLYQHTYKETRIGNIHLPAGVDLTLPMLSFIMIPNSGAMM